MKPVAICRYAPHEGPGYFATYLTQHRVPWCVIKLDRSEALPDVNDVTGLAMMGGAMSVNDDLRWIQPMLALIRACVACDVPVIGHCLGGQLLAKAIGGEVTRNTVKEIGWGPIDVVDNLVGREWGPADAFTSFHWHGETFSIPPRATRIWSSRHCDNQAFVLGNHIAMQCHVEMTEDMIGSWCETGAAEIARDTGRSPGVQSAAAMRENLAARVETLHRIADRVYSRWLQGVEKGLRSSPHRISP